MNSVIDLIVVFAMIGVAASLPRVFGPKRRPAHKAETTRPAGGPAMDL
jgi:hypothetical protein